MARATNITSEPPKLSHPSLDCYHQITVERGTGSWAGPGDSPTLVLEHSVEDEAIRPGPDPAPSRPDNKTCPFKRPTGRFGSTKASPGRVEDSATETEVFSLGKTIKMVDFAPTWFSMRPGSGSERLSRRLSGKKKAESDLVRQKKNLEKLVEERTSELKKVNIKLNQEIAKRRNHEDLMRVQRNLGFDLVSVTQPDQAFDLCIQAACSMEGVDGASLFFQDADSDRLRVISSQDFFDVYARRLFSVITKGKGPGPVIPKTPVFFNQQQLAARFADLKPIDSLRTLACLPIRKKGSVVAVILLVSMSTDRFPDSIRDALMNMGAWLEGALARLWAEMELKEAHDNLEKKVGQRTAELSEANTRLKREVLERSRAEQALIRSEENARALLNATTEQMMLLDAENRILAINETGARILGSVPAELIGQNAFKDLEPELARWRETVAKKATRFGAIVRFEDTQEEKIYQHNLYPVINRDGQNDRLAIFSLDVTARRSYEQQLLDYQKKLRLLASELAMAESRERRRLADDLHDRICQILYLCNMKAQEVRGWVTDSRGQTVMDEMVGYLEQAIGDSRELLMEISPPTLKILGLEVALEALGEDIQTKHNLKVLFLNDDRPKPLSEDMKDLVYRATRELVLNAVKHSRAQTVNLTVTREDSLIKVSVEDDGIGFEVEVELDPGRNPDRFGLFSIRERLKALGGDLYVDSTPGWGTRACLTAPLVDENQDADGNANGY